MVDDSGGHSRPSRSGALDERGSEDPDFAPAQAARRERLRVGEVELDVDGHQLYVAGQPVHITHKELQLLRHLLVHAGRVCPRRELLDAAWGVGYEEPSTHGSIEVFMLRIRRQLSEHGSAAERIRTVRGLGYVFDR